MNLTTFLKHIGNDNSGATAVEYGLIVGLIVIAIIVSLSATADGTTGLWETVRDMSVAAMGEG